MHKITLPSWAVMMGEPLEKVFFFVPWGHCSVFFFIIKIAPPGCPKTVTEKTRVPGPAMSISDAHRWAIFTHPTRALVYHNPVTIV